MKTRIKVALLLVFIISVNFFLFWTVQNFIQKREELALKGKRIRGLLTEVEVIPTPLVKICFVKGFFLVSPIHGVQFVDIGAGKFCDKMISAQKNKDPVDIIVDHKTKKAIIKGNGSVVELYRKIEFGVAFLSLVVVGLFVATQGRKEENAEVKTQEIEKVANNNIQNKEEGHEKAS